MRRWLLPVLFLALVPLAFACAGSDEPAGSEDALVEADVAGETAAEVATEVPTEVTLEVAPDSTTEIPGDVVAETSVELPGDEAEITDVPAELPPLAIKPPLATPADPLPIKGSRTASPLWEQ